MRILLVSIFLITLMGMIFIPNAFGTTQIVWIPYGASNGNNYDCAIAVSGGKDSHFQTHIIKDKLKMNPLLLSVGNFEWTDAGRKNLDNLSDAFGCDTN